MELNEAIKTRRSIRKFSTQSIDDSAIGRIIEAGHWAPSHCNTQAWRFIVVKNEQLRQKMVATGGSPLITKSPTGILVLYQDTSENLIYNDYIQSTAAAIQNMLLTAHDMGLGGCWICHLPPKRILRKIFSIPKDFIPIAYVALGHSIQQIIPVPRKHNISQIVSYNKFNFKFEKTSKIRTKTKQLLKTIYFLSPQCVRQAIIPFVNKFFVKKFDN